MNEIVKKLAFEALRMLGGEGISDENGVSSTVFFNWFYPAEVKILIINDLCDTMKLDLELLLPYLQNIKLILEKGKIHYLELSLNAYLQEELSQLTSAPITLDTIYERYDYPIRWIIMKEQELKKGKEMEYEDRIKGKLDKNQITAYFMQLSDFPFSNKGRKEILTPEQISHLVHANFAGFYPKVDKQKWNTPGIKQNQLRKFVYTFYLKHSILSQTEDYIHFLKDNFSLFDNTEFQSLKSNFSK